MNAGSIPFYLVCEMEFNALRHTSSRFTLHFGNRTSQRSLDRVVVVE